MRFGFFCVCALVAFVAIIDVACSYPPQAPECRGPAQAPEVKMDCVCTNGCDCSVTGECSCPKGQCDCVNCPGQKKVATLPVKTKVAQPVSQPVYYLYNGQYYTQPPTYSYPTYQSYSRPVYYSSPMMSANCST